MSRNPWAVTPLLWESLRVCSRNFGWAYQFSLEYDPTKRQFISHSISRKLIPWLTILFFLNTITIFIPSGLLIFTKFFGFVKDVPLIPVFVCTGAGMLVGVLAA